MSVELLVYLYVAIGIVNAASFYGDLCKIEPESKNILASLIVNAALWPLSFILPLFISHDDEDQLP